MYAKISLLAAAGLLAAACTSTGNVERNAAAGAALGGIAGAAIGNNVGDGDATRGAAIGAAVGGAAGAYKGYREDQRVQGRTGPNGGDLYYDERARRYFYVDRDGCTYWQNGQYRGC